MGRIETQAGLSAQNFNDHFRLDENLIFIKRWIKKKNSIFFAVIVIAGDGDKL